jgi:hypothetical protein
LLFIKITKAFKVKFFRMFLRRIKKTSPNWGGFLFSIRRYLQGLF